MKICGKEEFSLSSISSVPPLSGATDMGIHGTEALTNRAELDAYREALDGFAIVATTDRAGRISDVNQLFCDISGYDREELIGADHRILNSGYHPPHFFRQMWRAISTGTVWRADICNRAKDGRLYWVDTTIAARRDPNGRLLGYVSIRFDITTRKAAEAEVLAELRRREATEGLLSDIIEAIPNGIIAYDPQGRPLFCNDAHRRLYASASPMPLPSGASSATQNSSDDTAQKADRRRNKAITRPYIQQLDAERWIQVHNRQSGSGNLVSVQTDISALKRAQMQIKHQAERDSLTGVSNRDVIMRRLGNLSRSRKTQAGTAMLMVIDLDDFKLVNDRFGHDGGDTLLQQISERLQSSVRRSDTVARLGGDEFAILMRDIADRETADRIAGKLLETVKQPVRIGQQTIIPSASIGVALFPGDGKTPGELVKNADLALYQAKLNGRRRHSLYDRSMRQERKRRAYLTERLREALARNELNVVFQPQSDVQSRRHTGFEALVRWDVEGEAVPPPELISIAEEAGLITELSYGIIDTALTTMAALKRDRLSPGTIAFNIVTAQLREPDFAERLSALIEEHGLSANEIEIEVTENVILDRSAGDIAHVLRQLRKAGMSISLDDFGTGYASLTHLKRFPIDRLKIDRSFVSGILEEKDDEVIVRTIISLAHSLNLEVVAEGVETLDQYKQLSNFGCNFIQGFLLARPMDERNTRDYLETIRQSQPLAFHSGAVGF